MLFQLKHLVRYVRTLPLDDGYNSFFDGEAVSFSIDSNRYKIITDYIIHMN